MIKIIFFLSLYFILPKSIFATEFKAYVKNNNTQINSTIIVNFEYNDFSNNTPDFRPLQKDFKIISSSKGSQTSIINGYKTVKTTWELELLPLSSNKQLVIPSIKFEQTSSNQIIINLDELKNNLEKNTDTNITFVAHIDKPDAYIHEQVILTLTLKTPYKLLQGEIEELVLNDASIENLGDTKTNEEIINGIVTYIFTKKYAIFFDKSKEYNIPALVFEGLVQKEEQINSFFMPSFFSKPHRVIEKSLPIPINIKPIPAEFPQYQTFIPLDDLIIEEKFTNQAEFSTNDAIVRTFIIKGIKTLTSMLPLPVVPNIDGIKVYSESSNKKQKENNNSIESQIEISHTYIPQKPGDFFIEEQIIYWWDTKTNSLKTSIIRPLTLKITGSSIIENKNDINKSEKSDNNNTKKNALINKKQIILLIIFFSIITSLFMLFIAVKYKKKSYNKILITLTNLNKALKSENTLQVYQLLNKLKIQAKEENNIKLLKIIDSKLIQKNILSLEIKLYNKNNQDIKINFNEIYQTLNNKNNEQDNLLKPLYPS